MPNMRTVTNTRIWMDYNAQPMMPESDLMAKLNFRWKNGTKCDKIDHLPEPCANSVPTAMVFRAPKPQRGCVVHASNRIRPTDVY